MEMEVIILAWYILVETQSVFLLTVYGALNFGGTLISPILGTVSDRVGPRRLLTLTRLYYAANALAIMALAIAGLLAPTIVLILVGLMGLIRPSDQGLRTALIADFMPTAFLTHSLGLSRLTSDSARAAGALAGAALAALLGMEAAYMAIAILYLLGALLTARVETVGRHADPVIAATSPPAWRELMEGLVYIRSKPSLIAIILLVLLFNFTAFPITNGLFPYIAREVYHVDQTGLGYIVATLSIGAMLGGVIVGNARLSTKIARLMVTAALIWHALLLIFVQVASLVPALPLLFIIGIAQSLAMIALTVLLVRELDVRFRGRVMGVRMLAIYTLPLGLMLSGVLIEWIGFAATGSIYAGLGLIFTALIAFLWRSDFWRRNEDSEL